MRIPAASGRANRSAEIKSTHDQRVFSASYPSCWLCSTRTGARVSGGVNRSTDCIAGRPFSACPTRLFNVCLNRRKTNNGIHKKVSQVRFEPATFASGGFVARAASSEHGTNLRDNLCFNLFETSDLNSHPERGAHIFQWSVIGSLQPELV